MVKRKIWNSRTAASALFLPALFFTMATPPAFAEDWTASGPPRSILMAAETAPQGRAVTGETMTLGSREGRDALDTRLSDMHRTLGITTQQEALWATFERAVRSDDKGVDASTSERARRLSVMRADENLHSYQRIALARVSGLSTVVPAFDALYGSMSEDQKKNADIAVRARPLTQ